MKILVTGSEGFIGKNLLAELKNRGYEDVLVYDKQSTPEHLVFNRIVPLKSSFKL